MVMAANLKGKGGRNGSRVEVATPAAAPPLFSAEALKMQRMMRCNPLPLLNPESLGQWLDQFDAGHLRMAAQLWDQMAKRDDTLVTVKPQLENAVASQDWGVFTVQDADPIEAARHKAALDYFYDHVQAVDAFDRNERGGRDKFIEQMMRADSFVYAVHHFVWKPQPGRFIDVPLSKTPARARARDRSEDGGSKMEDGRAAAPVPALTAEMEYVPLWFFENTTGRLRFLKDGGFGINGEELNWDGEWMCTAGRGLMFAAAICYTFKRLSFQDWMTFMERYANAKIIIQTPAQKGTTQGNDARSIAENFNQDLAFIFYETQAGGEPPISLLGPEGTASVDIWAKFIERQDAKMSAMYRGNDLSMMSRAGEHGEKRIGASLQQQEGDSMEKGACRRIAGVLQECVDRKVIEFCFGVGVEPLAYFGLPDADVEDTAELRSSAEFLVKHGARVVLSDIAERLGVQLAPEGDDSDLLVAPEPAVASVEEGDLAGKVEGGRRKAEKTANTQPMTPEQELADTERFLGPLAERFKKALSNDLIPLRLAIEHVVFTPNQALQDENVRTLRAQLPWLLEQINRNPQSAQPLAEIIKTAFQRGLTQRSRRNTES